MVVQSTQISQSDSYSADLKVTLKVMRMMVTGTRIMQSFCTKSILLQLRRTCRDAEMQRIRTEAQNAFCMWVICALLFAIIYSPSDDKEI